MSLFKIFRGSQKDLKNLTNTTEGYAYYTDDDSHLYIDTATTGKDGIPLDLTKRKKVIGLSTINKRIGVIWAEDSKQITIANPLDSNGLDQIDFFKAEGYTYIISPTPESYDDYVEAGIRAIKINEGSMTLSCKEIPRSGHFFLSILRIEEDPYAKI